MKREVSARQPANELLDDLDGADDRGVKIGELLGGDPVIPVTAAAHRVDIRRRKKISADAEAEHITGGGIF